MKIGLNATCFNNRPSGAKQRFIGIYSKLFSRMKNDVFIIYEPVDCGISEWFDHHDNVTYVKTPLYSERRYQKYVYGVFYWPKVFEIQEFDIFENFSLPLVKRKKGLSFLTIHDIRGLHLYDGWIKRMFYSAVLRYSIKNSDHIITVSNYMKNEISNYFPDTLISVIYNGIDVEGVHFAEQDVIRATLCKFNLPNEYMLSVGHFEPRKNYPRLIEALKILHNMGNKKSLVIVGNDSGEMSSIIELSESLGLSNYVTILNGITDNELSVLYQDASIFIFPSLYEGFGIPILEAMNAKIPIVLSDIPVFREIVGSNGVYFNCYDPKSIANSINTILTSKNTRQRLIECGVEKVKMFNFYNISKKVQTLYDQNR